MKELWNKTSDIFWEHPILWLPVLAADLLGQCATQLQRLLTHRIVLSLVERHSVLGNSTEFNPYQSSVVMKAALLSTPIKFGAYFINICLYALAFVVTARLVSSFLQHLPVNLRCSANEVAHARRALIFASKMFAMFILAGILLAALDQLAVSAHQTKLLAMPLWTLGVTVVVYVCIAYCIAPSSLRLIADRSQFLSSEAIWMGRRIAILIVAALPVVAFCVQKVEQSFIGALPVSLTVRLVTGAIASLVVAFCYVPLFIALSLIANQDDEVQVSVHEAG